MADAQSDQHPVQWAGPRPVDGTEEIADRYRPEPFQPFEGRGGERIEVGDIGEHAVRHEQFHPLLAQPFDVHRRPGGEVGDPLHALGRAVEVGAEGVALVGQPDQGTAAARAHRREPPGPSPTPSRAAARHRTDHLGDHITGLAHDHHVA